MSICVQCLPHLSRFEVLDKLEKKNFTMDRLREMDSKEIGHLIHHVRAGGDVKKAAMEIPVVELEATIQVGNGILYFTNITRILMSMGEAKILISSHLVHTDKQTHCNVTEFRYRPMLVKMCVYNARVISPECRSGVLTVTPYSGTHAFHSRAFFIIYSISHACIKDE